MGLSQLPTTRSADAISVLSRASTTGAVRLETAEMSPMKTSRRVTAGAGDASEAAAGSKPPRSPRSDGCSRRGSQDSL